MRLGKATGRASTAAIGAIALLACLLVPASSPAAEQTRYSLANGCYALQDSDGKYVVKGDGTYDLGKGKSKAEPFRMQATDLGSYLLYDADRDFFTGDGNAVVVGADPSEAGNWRVRERGAGFSLANNSGELDVDGGALAFAGSGDGEAFAFTSAKGCKKYPEVEVNARGPVRKGTPSYGTVAGLVEGHLHHMAFEFLGGDAHCGKPWDPFGAPVALTDCPDHELGGGCAAILENALYGNPARCHDPVGWPTFNDWPDPHSLTHEQTYYKWVERAWRGGLRVFVMLSVENRTLCEIYPIKHRPCNEMQSVLREIHDAYALQDYIDAQYGGPGKGWYRIVKTPFAARRVINQGKLAVVLGMEVSEPFDCRIEHENTPIESSSCDEDQIDTWLDRLQKLGVRQLEVINKFDNPISGVAGDGGTTGVLTSAGQLYATGSFWEYGQCENDDHADNVPEGVHNDDLIIANGIDALLGTTLPPLPIYPDPGCNQRGLGPMGPHAVNAIMDRQMIFDPDHMSVIGRQQAMKIVLKHRYPGIFSSHSWSTDDTYKQIYRLGGVITPYAGGSEGFVHQWQHLKQMRRGIKKRGLARQYWGMGYGADMNGFGSQGAPRGADVPNPVTYPFKSWDGTVTFGKQHSGQRVYDINVDGVAHYGLYPDWVEDLRQIAGKKIVRDMGRGAEAYLQMWERTVGIKPRGCGGWGGKHFSSHRLGKRIGLGTKPKTTLRKAGQPWKRTTVWRWCAGKRQNVFATFGTDKRVGLILSTRNGHTADGIDPGDPVKDVRGGFATNHGHGLYTRPTGDGTYFVYHARGKRIGAVGIASAGLGGSESALRAAVHRAVR